jgi:hypothetical protein
MVFDVTQSEFYKPGQGYGVFAGSDATVALGKMSLSSEWLNKTGEVQLTSQEIEILKGW